VYLVVVEDSPHLLAAIDAVQSLLQLSKCVALQALSCLLWDGGQWLPQQRGLRLGGTRLLWLHLLELKSQRRE